MEDKRRETDFCSPTMSSNGCAITIKFFRKSSRSKAPYLFSPQSSRVQIKTRPNGLESLQSAPRDESRSAGGAALRMKSVPPAVAGGSRRYRKRLGRKK